ncbi:MAG: aminotransferase class III-fold pyridoxal phosphate-dependent enzyme [Candidatus Lindowbacteria bacterium]|nr:aminotransferase class III-fold pyridoxal phosphate-dependent enzyme [Candidatus Lindowbacteria bacterium]
MAKFDKSYRLFDRASKVIPGGIPGHQSPMLLVFGASPCFIERAKGARFWDVDGNEYIDYMCAYGPMVLGYNHPKVEAAAQAQSKKTDTGNLPSERYVELAERLVGLVPIADWAIFGKNGSDVTTYACRVARSQTGRNKIIMVEGSYHGIGGWCTPVTAGVTPGEKDDMLTFNYNDVEGFKQLAAENKDDLAGVILTPFRHEAFHDSEMPAPGFLETVRKTCDETGGVFIVDDVRAGFRMHTGGSLERFGVKPDLICFSKALGNGHPIAACVGKEDLRSAASQVFFTGSFFTSGVPMAAALATLDEMEATGAIEIMYKNGEMLKDGMLDQADAYGQQVSYTGPETIPFMTFAGDDGWEKAKVFCEECYQRGVFFHPFHNWFISSAHTEEDIRKTLDATDAAFKRVKEKMG